MDLELIKTLAELGVSVLIAGLVLIWKRADDKEHRAELVKLTERTEAREAKLLELAVATTDALRALESTVAQLVQLDRLEERLRRGAGRG